MFFRQREKRSPFSFIFVIFRLFLSLVIMGVLLIGIYSAYKTFSGVDPLKVDPKTLVVSLLSSEQFIEVVKGLLSTDPKVGIEKAKQVIGKKENVSQPSINISNKPKDFVFAVVSDSHNDNENLQKALNQAKNQGAEFVIGLGDYSEVGTLDELNKAGEVFNSSGLPYYVTAGDHDLWDSRNQGKPASKNFVEIFGSPYSSFGYKDVRVIIFYNSDNYNGLDSPQWSWLEQELDRVNQNKPKIIFAFTGIPLYHPSSDHIMGKENKQLKSQAEGLTSLFKNKGVAELFAGDAHFFSRYTEPKTNLPMTAIGAITSKRNVQKPRYSLVEVFTDGSYNVQDVEIQ